MIMRTDKLMCAWCLGEVSLIMHEIMSGLMAN